MNWTTRSEAPRGDLSFPRAVAFSTVSMPLMALTIAITVHLPAYLATSVGIPMTTVAAAFFFCRIVDIPVEPVLGVLMDRTRTRIGRYRVWALIGAPLLMGGLYLLLRVRPPASATALIVCLLIMYLGMSILVLALMAWASNLAQGYDARSRIFGIISGVSVLGPVGLLATPTLVHCLGMGSAADGVRAMIWYIIGLTPIAVAISVGLTPEPIPSSPGERTVRLGRLARLLRNGSLIRILVADLCLTLGPGWMAAMFLFFFRDVKHFTTAQASLCLLINILAGLVGAPTIAWLATKIGKPRAAVVASAVYTLALASMPALPQSNVIASIPTHFAMGFVAAGFTALIRAMLADVADEVRLVDGQEHAGLLFSLTSATTKVALAASIIITFPLLEKVGYRPSLGMQNPPSALQALTVLFVVGPVAFLALGSLSFVGYRLTAARVAEVRRQLGARDRSAQVAAASSVAAPGPQAVALQEENLA